MTQLFCIVLGVGTIFSVDVDLREKVDNLKDRIKAKNPELTDRPAFTLTLYLARRDGEWLAETHPDVARMKQGEIPDAIKAVMATNEMRSSARLCKPEYFGEGVEEEDEVIHVLVEPPPPPPPKQTTDDASASDSSLLGKWTNVAEKLLSTTEKTARLTETMHDHLMEPKTKRFVHSQVNSTQGRELLRLLHIQVVVVPTVPPRSLRSAPIEPIEPFEWEDVQVGDRGMKASEEQHRDKYREYVAEHIGAELLRQKKLCVIGVENGSNILTVDLPGYGIQLAGRTDLLVLSDVVVDDPTSVPFLPNVKMLIEVKRDVNLGAVYQTLSELIALDLLARDAVMALVTNLTDEWHFFWVSELDGRNIIVHKAIMKTPGEAFATIQKLVSAGTRDSDAKKRRDDSLEVPLFERPIKRSKLMPMLETLVGGDGDGGEADGVREALQRYFDIASMLGPDLEMARVTVRQIIQPPPNFSFYT